MTIIKSQMITLMWLNSFDFTKLSYVHKIINNQTVAYIVINIVILYQLP